MDGWWTAMRHHGRGPGSVVTMYPDGTRVAPLLNEYRKSDAVQFLGSREVGELADSEFNTILCRTA